MTIIETSDLVIVPLPELPGTQSISLSAPGGALHIHYDMGTYVIGLPPGYRLICALNEATEEQKKEYGPLAESKGVKGNAAFLKRV